MSHPQTVPEMKFEPNEVNGLNWDDHAAGEVIGKLLAFIFCILMVLMVSVTIWTMQNQSKSMDPHARDVAPSSSH